MTRCVHFWIAFPCFVCELISRCIHIALQAAASCHDASTLDLKTLAVRPRHAAGRGHSGCNIGSYVSSPSYTMKDHLRLRITPCLFLVRSSRPSPAVRRWILA
ncbi:hypothetical protein BJ166DRAFT_534203 [Pestalotiopsis sp. NC0098]|nr:hypothetical protein BJ166DRAFT_534203 [Pestalotiopsis sp. NC0098]